jgi:hypothetical protein
VASNAQAYTLALEHIGAELEDEDEPQRQMSMKRLSRDEAQRIAANIAKLPDLLHRAVK